MRSNVCCVELASSEGTVFSAPGHLTARATAATAVSAAQAARRRGPESGRQHRRRRGSKARCSVQLIAARTHRAVVTNQLL